MLPPDTELVADLTALTFTIGPNGIKVIPKETLVELLGRSPDRGDAVVMAAYVGQGIANVKGGRQPRKSKEISVNLGRFGNRRRA